MSEKNKKEIPDLDTLTREEKMKYEIAEELGLLDRVMEDFVCQGDRPDRRAGDPEKEGGKKSRV